MPHLYNIFHIYDTDGGFGDAVEQKDFVGLVEATEEELQKFLQIWNKPRVYDRPYSALREHTVVAERVQVKELSEIVPYDPATRDWPDLPKNVHSFYSYNGKEWVYAN